MGARTAGQVLSDAQGLQTYAVSTEDFAVKQENAGNRFFYQENFSLADSASKIYVLATPNTTKWAHMTITVENESQEASVILKEAISTSADGTGITELNRNRNSSTAEINARTMVKRSISEARPNTQVTAAINPKAAALTPSNIPAAQGDFRGRGMIGLLIATKKNDGRKIPIVAISAPGTPPRI